MSKKPKVTVVGSLNMDLVVSMPRMPKQGETLTGDAIHYIPGGKGANQAVGCARLGAEVTMIGAVGSDGFGERILQDMRRYGVSAEAIAVLANKPTGTASIFHTPEDNSIVIVPGANGAVTPEMIDAHASAITSADIVLLQLEIPLDAVVRALQIARAGGVRTVLNPAPAVPLPQELLTLCDFVTPNEHEFELLSSLALGESDELIEQGIRVWEERYGNKLLMTRGKHGVSYLDDSRLRTAPAPFVEAVDTTGAGDCFNAAVCYGLASGWEMGRAVPFAVKAASLSVTRFGAQAGMPTLQEVESL
ncbi:ribokinase [Paenibacillus sp. J5C_2022]|uniref:ribokinase n=1 Tax=Paenibacillus sp. J5C2022 TaxID=2977129 RepID=UPI0021D2C619|nr:ribokinase [Paenibacillus sp. J5C2022]MCU6707721.1 ribokinase [Paenibacillus sp. J5C2022]